MDPNLSGPDLHVDFKTGVLVDDKPTLNEVKRRYVLHVLSGTGGNKVHAAKILGVSRSTIDRVLARSER